MSAAPPAPYSLAARDRLTAALAARDLDALYTAGMAALDAYDERHEMWDQLRRSSRVVCQWDGCPDCADDGSAAVAVTLADIRLMDVSVDLEPSVFPVGPPRVIAGGPITPHFPPTCSINGCSSTDVITVPSGNWCARHVVTGGWPNAVSS